MNDHLTMNRPLAGLIIALPDACQCGATLVEIEVGCGPHRAGLRCLCGRHRGWMSGTLHDFLTAIVAHFSRPANSIVIRNKTNSEICADAQTATPLGAGEVSVSMHPAMKDDRHEL
jgi:hypothetical protein